MKPFVSLVFLLALASSAAPAQADRTDDYIKATMRHRHIPGLSLLVLHNGKIIKQQGYGLASLELGVPAKPETVYALASTTKPFIATGILLLAEQKRLRLDDPIGQYVPNIPESWKAITLRHLLSHTSGIKDYPSDLRLTFSHDTPPEKIIEAVAKAPLNFAPGAKWAYSNTGFVLLTMVLEKVSGKPWGAFLTERIFTPLGMSATRRDEADAIVPQRATGYLWWGGTLHNAMFLKHEMPHHGDEGLLSSVVDLAKWDAALRSEQILSKASRDALWTPTKLNDGSNAGYGLGWFLETHNGHRNISHAGGNPGTAAIFALYPDDKLTVIVLANQFGAVHIQALAQGVAQCYLPDMRPKNTITLPTKQLDTYTGYYNIFGGQVVKVKREKSQLVLDDGSYLANDLLALSETRFVASDTDRGVVFTKDASGTTTGLTLRLMKDEFPGPYLGPFIDSTTPQPDPDPTRTQRIEAALKALQRGVKTDEPAAKYLAPGTLEDFSNGPAPELNGIQKITFVYERSVPKEQIERHREKVAHILGFQFLTDSGPRGVLIYLTADGRIADEDVVGL